MRIAITADLHLTHPEKHPERFNVLDNILSQMREDHISTLVIAGDLFDSEKSNISAFEAICARPDNQSLRIIILPGNHDLFLTNAYLAAENIRVIEEPTIAHFTPNGKHVLLLPYQTAKPMGEVIAQYKNKLPCHQWTLISHGDYTGGLTNFDSNQNQVYMPLTRQDVELFKPANVILGHIHAPLDDKITYTGSPCGLDITETGKRRFLIYNLNTNQMESRATASDVLFFNEHFLVLPVEDEETYIRKIALERIQSWDLPPGQYANARVRIRCSGYSRNREQLQKTFNHVFENYPNYQDKEPDLSEVFLAKDSDRFEITEQVLKLIAKRPGLDDQYAPSSDQIIEAALQIIYGN